MWHHHTSFRKWPSQLETDGLRMGQYRRGTYGSSPEPEKVRPEGQKPRVQPSHGTREDVSGGTDNQDYPQCFLYAQFAHIFQVDDNCP